MVVIGHLRADLKMMKEGNTKPRHERELLEKGCHKQFLQMEKDGKAKTQVIKDLQQEGKQMTEDRAEMNQMLIQADGNAEEMKRKL